MRTIFEKGYFHSYKIPDSRRSTLENKSELLLENLTFSGNTKVFLSHKHSDLEDLKDIVGFFEQEYNIDVYIDSMDKAMPDRTCGATATRIKKIINKCDKFILLATDEAVESKWCNWELGYGDALKFRDNIALFAIKDKGNYDFQYKGKEYLSIYPHIIYFYGSEQYDMGNRVTPGFYYGYENEFGQTIIISLSDWLKK